MITLSKDERFLVLRAVFEATERGECDDPLRLLRKLNVFAEGEALIDPLDLDEGNAIASTLTTLVNRLGGTPRADIVAVAYKIGRAVNVAQLLGDRS